MSEEAARAVMALSQSISNGEDNRERLLEQVSQLTGTMAHLNEALADDRRIRDHLAQLNANIMQLSEDLRADRNRQADIVASELRGLSSSIAAMMDRQNASRQRGIATMALARIGNARRVENFTWPGFVDALATLLMVIIFVLMVFVLDSGEFGLSCCRARCLPWRDAPAISLAWRAVEY